MSYDDSYKFDIDSLEFEDRDLAEMVYQGFIDHEPYYDFDEGEEYEELEFLEGEEIDGFNSSRD